MNSLPPHTQEDSTPIVRLTTGMNHRPQNYRGGIAILGGRVVKPSTSIVDEVRGSIPWSGARSASSPPVNWGGGELASPRAAGSPKSGEAKSKRKSDSMPIVRLTTGLNHGPLLYRCWV